MIIKKKRKKISNFINLASLISNFISIGLLSFISITVLKFIQAEPKSISALLTIIVLFIVFILIGFVTSFLYKDSLLKKILLGFNVIVIVFSATASFFLLKFTSVAETVTSESGFDQFETISFSFTTYNNSSISSIKDLGGKKLGIIPSTMKTDSSNIAKNYLDKNSINPNYVEFDSLNDIFLGLIQGKVDCAIMPAGYNAQLSEEEGYIKYLEKTKDIYTHNEKVKLEANQSYNKNLSVEPFNILLIGYAPESGTSIDDGYGLADAIIMASVNPTTYEVSMISIPRDSYVQIAGSKGYDKITHSRGKSRDTLIKTVENLLDQTIDFYMEINFKGIVDVVNALGGIPINSPVEFIGQDHSNTRGEMTVYVPQGETWADGNQALAFARERHAMPNGDFDRQRHQQEVIVAIAERLFMLNSITKALDVMQAAGNNFKTNLSISQLTNLFNFLVANSNNNGLSTISQITFNNYRLYGYDSWMYSYSEELPLWIYRLYNGSINEAQKLIDETLRTNTDVSDQAAILKFMHEFPYDDTKWLQTSFDEAKIEPDLPLFVVKLQNYSPQEASSWAKTEGVLVKWYDDKSNAIEEPLDGYIVNYEPGYGKLLENYGNTVTIYVAGSTASTKQTLVPNFIGLTLEQAKEKAKEAKLFVKFEYNNNQAGTNLVILQDVEKEIKVDKESTIKLTIDGVKSIQMINLVGITLEEAKQWLDENELEYSLQEVENKENNPTNTIVAQNIQEGQLVTTQKIVLTIYKQQQTQPQQSCGDNQQLNTEGVCECVSGYEKNSEGLCILKQSSISGE